MTRLVTPTPGKPADPIVFGPEYSPAGDIHSWRVDLVAARDEAASQRWSVAVSDELLYRHIRRRTRR